MTGAAAATLTPTLNAHAVDIFFQELATQIPDGAHVILVWNQAGYHTSHELCVPKNVSLLICRPARRS